MITGELKSKVDRLWDAFWSGGISNPLAVIEQISYLLFIKRLDDLELLQERKANRTGKPVEKPLFSKSQQHLRWHRFKDKDAQTMFETVRDEVFPFIRKMHGEDETSYSKHMEGANFIISNAGLLQRVVDMIDDIPMEDRDTKGDLYEYMLGKIASSGTNGQFRTPRHIIKMMVELMAPSTRDKICDPACGTAGFLTVAAQYVSDTYQDELMKKQFRDYFSAEMFTGFDFDSTMLRIGSMNMLLHGAERARVEYADSLSKYFEEKDEYTMILANPPFKGSIDETQLSKELSDFVTTRKTELLFIALFVRLLKAGGRAAIIVPDGVLFTSANAHKSVRMHLVEDHRLEAVISMPSGVFKPYAGVSTGILIFTKTNNGGTDNVWFYDMQADGYSLDDKRNPLDQNKHDDNNIPDILKRFKALDKEKKRKRTDQSFLVPKDEIVQNNYDLSINRYKEIEHEAVEYESPKKILADIEKLEKEILAGVAELKGML
jgi:type I restriction enzyme M protein